ncbi:hypothetical protein CC80DRAFT_598061 [Byssothecium circinans]|uniref:Uncharacterized protein n=1 Tax=Byssothecium circinans TaxID=147558 RepID=A0A6A5TIL3_9PLEO|nr:hypothetical protein CC80DRAFT_598061 [Byssothecium circinans]
MNIKFLKTAIIMSTNATCRPLMKAKKAAKKTAVRIVDPTPKTPSDSEKQRVDTPINLTTYELGCFACEYSSPEEQKKCPACKPSGTSPSSKKNLRAATRVQNRALPITTSANAASIFNAYPDEKEAVDTLRKLAGFNTESSYSSIARTRPGKKILTLVGENPAQSTPAISLSSAENEAPTMDLKTWIVLGKCGHDGHGVHIITKEKVSRKKKHAWKCKCNKCVVAYWMNGGAKMLNGVVDEESNKKWNSWDFGENEAESKLKAWRLPGTLGGGNEMVASSLGEGSDECLRSVYAAQGGSPMALSREEEVVENASPKKSRKKLVRSSVKMASR